jgi:phosphotransferase system HPr (HPr) family protein
MNPSLQRIVRINNPQGLHMRPAAAFSETASRFQCTVIVRRDAQSVDGKNWIELLLLAAEVGTELTIEVSGQDAHEAIEVLTTQLEAVPPDEK